MKTRNLLMIFAFAWLGCSSLAVAGVPKGFETESLVLYQTDSVLHERVSSVEDLGDYVQRLQEVCKNFFATTTTPETLHIVVALKPGKQSRVWFVSSTRSPGDKEREPLRSQLEAVTSIDVRQGPVVFAISAKLAGGDPKARPAGGEYQPPIPKEWLDAAKGHATPLVFSEGLLELVWPGAAPATKLPDV